MITDLETIKSYFAKLKLEPEIGSLYLALCLHGPQTITGLAQHSGIERTRIYRLKEPMEQCGLFKLSVDNKRKIYRAAPISNLQVLLSKREEELQKLEIELGQVDQMLHAQLQTPLTHIQFYRGKESLKQLFWNQTRADGEVYCILNENMQYYVGSVFFSRWVRKCNERNIHFRGIIGESFQNDQKRWYDKHHNERLQHWQQRSVPSSIFKINHSTVTHDDRVIYYNLAGPEVYGIEIYNTEIARSQQGFFEILWEQGAPAKDVDVPLGFAGLIAKPDAKPTTLEI